MRQSIDRIVVDAYHRLGRNQGVDNRFFDGKDDGVEEGGQSVVRQHRQQAGCPAVEGAGVGGRKSQEGR